jgi:hypothetical protein
MPSVIMLSVIMLSVIMLSIIMLGVIVLSVSMPRVIIQSLIILNVIKLIVIRLCVIMLRVNISGVMLSVIMLNVAAPHQCLPGAFSQMSRNCCKMASEGVDPSVKNRSSCWNPPFVNLKKNCGRIRNTLGYQRPGPNAIKYFASVIYEFS